MRNIYKQFLICQEKVLDRVPRAACLPLGEIERVYETIVEKNGDPDHDAAFDTFSF